MAYTTINKGSSYFNTILYTGTGATNNITGVGFKPDLVWIKNRGNTDWHRLLDAVRGATNELYSNASNVETAQAQSLQTFNTDGFTLGTLAEVNGNANNFASWNWLANNTSGSSNTSGTITSTVAANTTAGFSIVKYTGNGTGNSTVGHGLSAVPKFIIVKSRTSADAWGTLSASFVSAADPNIVYLNNSAAEADDTNVWGTSANFTSSTFTVGTWNGSNANATDYIAYCWSEIKGYSKFGKYTGSGNSAGTFVYTGFKPAFVLVKSTTSADNWFLMDNKRDPFNPEYKIISPNTSSAEDAANLGVTDMDFLSNGFRLTTSWSGWNNSGQVNIYMAFAENPFVTSGGIPVTAR